MKKLKYSLSILLLAIPFVVGGMLGFMWRGFKAGFLTGFSTLQTSLELDLIHKVNEKCLQYQEEAEYNE